MHADGDESNIPLKPLEAMLSIDLAHPNIIHTYKFYTRVRQVCLCSYCSHTFLLCIDIQYSAVLLFISAALVSRLLMDGVRALVGTSHAIGRQWKWLDACRVMLSRSCKVLILQSVRCLKHG